MDRVRVGSVTLMCSIVFDNKQMNIFYRLQAFCHRPVMDAVQEECAAWLKQPASHAQRSRNSHENAFHHITRR